MISFVFWLHAQNRITTIKPQKNTTIDNNEVENKTMPSQSTIDSKPDSVQNRDKAESSQHTSQLQDKTLRINVNGSASPINPLTKDVKIDGRVYTTSVRMNASKRLPTTCWTKTKKIGAGQ